MKRKPLIPFLLIAVLGLLLTLGLSFIGLSEQAEREAEESGEASVEDDPVAYGEDLVAENCISCHGENLEGQGEFPAINNAASNYSAEEISTIAQEGIGDMPGGIAANAEEGDAIAEYLMSLEE
ncbi:cytochrome c550 [Sinobaca qinghaiensis]|uniref:Cytochrome c550 n=1 Tax=Sinobaca qinghaiensis TaxID=342944 RepID=A0A419V3G9_9BACL|nr:cytochrome c [Sinobaca qinghaiensis]RKD73020.1 cytochrome c550 [Sinobaca qinghaiensis]